MKTHVDRIHYYTRKVAEYCAVHPAKRKPGFSENRHKRLMTYKAAMHKRIEVDCKKII